MKRCLFHLRDGQLSKADYYKNQALTIYRQFHLILDESRLLKEIIEIEQGNQKKTAHNS